MEDVYLPTEKASEPSENARQPLLRPGEKINRKPNVDFNETMSNEKRPKKMNSGYGKKLSQPPGNTTQLQKLQWLQERRTTGLWVQCDSCDRWRYLSNVLDSYDLPKKWYCRMHPDSSLASCSVPEVPIELHDEEDLIHSEYAAGSLVLARLPGWPWWPAMVDDCPDTEQYYWLDGFSDIPTHYNVVFFDTEVSRAWLSPHQLKPYNENKQTLTKSTLKKNPHKKRLDVAMAQAADAEKLSLTERLQKYGFINRYKGPIRDPVKLNAKQARKYLQSLKRKFNIELPDNFFQSDDDEDDKSQGTLLEHGSGNTCNNFDMENNNKESSLTVQVGTDNNNIGNGDIDKPPVSDSLNQLMEVNTTMAETIIDNKRSESPGSNDFDF